MSGWKKNCGWQSEISATLLIIPLWEFELLILRRRGKLFMLIRLFWTFMATALLNNLNLYLPYNATLQKVTLNGRKG